MLRDDQKCKICGRSSDEVPLEVDHIVPVSKGGTDEINNLAALCKDCNSGKSDFNFSNYMDIDLLPEDIEKHLKYYQDDKTGDFEKYHLYCYFKNSNHKGPPDGEYHHEWKITGSQFAFSSNPAELKKRRRKEETLEFVKNIKKELAKEKRRLVLSEDGLIKQ